MIRDIYNILICPVCKNKLLKSGQRCLCKNNHSFKIKQGIPILIDYSSLQNHSKKQITFFESEQERPTLSCLTKLAAWKKSYLEKFHSHFPRIENRLILDCGTGVGYMAVKLAGKKSRVIATDITLKNLIQIKKLAKILLIDNNIDFICCSADNLPFKDKTFDYYISNAVLEHIPREKQAIEEIARVTKKGAGVMIAVPISYKYINPLFWLPNYFIDKKLGHLRRYNEVTFKEKFKKFELKGVYYTGHFKKVIKTIFNNLVKPIFNEDIIEKEDRLTDQIKYGASNVIFISKKL